MQEKPCIIGFYSVLLVGYDRRKCVEAGGCRVNGFFRGVCHHLEWGGMLGVFVRLTHK